MIQKQIVFLEMEAAMGISIKNEEVEELIRRMAEAINKPTTDAESMDRLPGLVPHPPSGETS